MLGGSQLRRFGECLQFLRSLRRRQWRRRRGGRLDRARTRLADVTTVTPIPIPAVSSLTPVTLPTRRLGHGLFQQPRPIELHVGVVCFQQPSGFVVQRRASDAYAGGCAEPVEQTLAATAASPATTRLHQRGRLIAALVAIDADLRQGYFLFVFLAGFAGFAFFAAAGFAFFGAGFGGLAGLVALGCGLVSLTGGRLTAFFAMSVKRV